MGNAYTGIKKKSSYCCATLFKFGLKLLGAASRM
jgi:hypothetical protein